MYDGTTNDARLNREILCRELRENPPADWDYSRANLCALGVAHRLGLMRVVDDCYLLAEFVDERLRMDRRMAKYIFFNPSSTLTPAQVAQAIERVGYV